MKKRIKAFLSSGRLIKWLPFVFGGLFVLYNALLGVLWKSKWHVVISVYYALLLAVKMILRGVSSMDLRRSSGLIKTVTCGLLFVMGISLAFPIIMMIRQERSVVFPLEVAIGIAAYTTYKVSVSVVGYVKAQRLSRPMEAEIATVGLVESVTAILTLQNTLITVNDGARDRGLFVLSVISSFVGFAFVMCLILRMIACAVSKDE